MTYKLVYKTEDAAEFQRVSLAFNSAIGNAPTDTPKVYVKSPESCEFLSDQEELALPTPVAKETKPRKTIKKVSVAMSDEGVVVNDAPESTPSTEPVAIAYDDIRKITLALIKAKGKQAALDVLEHMKVQAAPELKAEQYSEYAELVNVAMKRL